MFKQEYKSFTKSSKKEEEMLPNQLNEDFIKLIPKSKMLYKETKTTKYTPISIKSTDVKIPNKN